MKLEQILNESFSAFFAPTERVQDLKKELKSKLHSQGNLILASSKQASQVYFFQNQWRSPKLLRYSSVNDLKEIIRSYGLPSFYQPMGSRDQHSEFVTDLKVVEFGTRPHSKSWLEWTVLSNEFLLLCEQHEGFPLNTLKFVEDKNAPSRAYLKLWEVFTRFDIAPKAGEKCLELGSAPGGWTYVLDGLGAEVTSVDRAELDPKLMKSRGITHRLADAFAVMPSEFDKLDWFFSDLICFPEKLAEHVELWLASGKVRNFVCTLKFKGGTDWSAVRKFESFGGELVHLNQNKHELTWVKLQ